MIPYKLFIVGKKNNTFFIAAMDTSLIAKI